VAQRVRGVYGKPLSKMAGQTLPMTATQLKVAADIILKSIQKEIRKDMAKVAGIGGSGNPVEMPSSDKFTKSFKVRMKGASTIEIYSNWPTASAHTTKMKPGFVGNMHPDTSAPIEMKWLIRPAVPLARIVQKDGQVVIRTTPNPARGDGYWIHPGFKKYTFLERGLRKGRIEAAKALAAELLAVALQGVDIFE